MSVEKSLRGKKNWFVVAKLPGTTRFESVKNAMGSGGREFGSKSSAAELARDFRKHGIPAKVVRAQATI